MDQDAGLPSMDGWNVKIFSDRDVGRVTEVVLWVVWCGLCMCSVPQLNSTRDQIHQHLYLVTFFLFFFGIRNQEKISELFNTWNVLTAQLALVCHYNNLGVVFKTEPLEAAWKFFRLTAVQWESVFKQIFFDQIEYYLSKQNQPNQILNIINSGRNTSIISNNFLRSNKTKTWHSSIQNISV